MRRFSITVDVTETYKIFVDANDEEEASDAVYEMDVNNIIDGDYLGTEVEILDLDEISFQREE